MGNFTPGYDARNRMLASSFNCAAAANAVGVDPSNPGYDLSGNVLCAGAQNYNAQAYIYDAESRLTQVAGQVMNNTYNLSALYTYDAGGTRVRKDVAPFNGQAFTEYTYFNGQPLAEKDQDDHWTDYIYANGQKVAMSRESMVRARLSGTDMGTDPNGWAAYAFGIPSTLRSYVIRPGDRLSFRFFQHNAHGGVSLGFTDGSNTNWYCGVDQNGDCLFRTRQSRVITVRNAIRGRTSQIAQKGRFELHCRCGKYNIPLA